MAQMEGYSVHSSSCVSSRRRATRRARTPAGARLLPSEFARAARGLGLDARAQLSPARRPETAPAHWAPRSSSSRGWSSPGGGCAHAPTAPPGEKSRGSPRENLPPAAPRGLERKQRRISVSAISSSSGPLGRRAGWYCGSIPLGGKRPQAWPCSSR